MNHEEKAKELFDEGYNCAQSVFAAFCDEMNMDRQTALRLSSSFGGGMGRLREVCGAVSAMFMVAGALYGYDDPADQVAKAGHYEKIRQLAENFRKENKYITCRELLGLKNDEDTPDPEMAVKPCRELVGSAARIMEEYMQMGALQNS